RFARAQVLLAAAAAGKASIDTIHTDLKPTDQFIAEAQDAVASGWTAKACIHPAQVQVIRDAYRPTDEELEYASALLAQVRQQRGVFQFRGTMVDGPLIAHAQSIVNRAEKLNTRHGELPRSSSSSGFLYRALGIGQFGKNGIDNWTVRWDPFQGVQLSGIKLCPFQAV